MPFYIFARFDPKPGREQELREELERVLAPTRAEPGCVHIHYYESVRAPSVYFIHSEWVDEAAFDRHAGLPHTRRFAAAVEDLMTNPLQAIRTRQAG